MKKEDKLLARLMVIIPVAILLGIMVLFCTAIVSDTLTNNKIIAKYNWKFQKLDHPRNTHKINSFRHIMSPPGNGSDCFYFVGELRKTSSIESEIEEFYSTAEFYGELGLEFVKDGKFSEKVPYKFDNISQFATKNVSDSKHNIYTIYWLIPAYFIPNSKTVFDLRCQ